MFSAAIWNNVSAEAKEYVSILIASVATYLPAYSPARCPSLPTSTDCIYHHLPPFPISNLLTSLSHRPASNFAPSQPDFKHVACRSLEADQRPPHSAAPLAAHEGSQPTRDAPAAVKVCGGACEECCRKDVQGAQPDTGR